MSAHFRRQYQNVGTAARSRMQNRTAVRPDSVLARQRSSLDSLTSKACNTAARFLPALSIASASRSLAPIYSER